jgi:hypothetical protein
MAPPAPKAVGPFVAVSLPQLSTKSDFLAISFFDVRYRSSGSESRFRQIELIQRL